MAVFVNFNHKLAYKTITLKQANLFTIKDKSVLKEGRCVEIVDMKQVLRGVIGSQHIIHMDCYCKYKSLVPYARHHIIRQEWKFALISKSKYQSFLSLMMHTQHSYSYLNEHATSKKYPDTHLLYFVTHFINFSDGWALPWNTLGSGYIPSNPLP